GKNRFSTMHQNLAMRYSQRFTPIAAHLRSSMYTRDFFSLLSEHNRYARLINSFCDIAHLDAISQLQYVDVHNYLTDDILVKVDKASMFNSLETRAPLLDQYLAEYVSSLPSSIVTRDGVLKALLKKVAADILPAETLSRPKQGFGVPLKHWFRRDLTAYAHEMLTSARARQRGIFDLQF